MSLLMPMCIRNKSTCYTEIDDDLLDAHVIVCTSTRQLILCRSGTPIRSCDLPFNNAQTVRVLYTYDPFAAFILIFNGSTLLVVPYDKILKITSTWEHVSSIVIGDFRGNGTSQVSINQTGTTTVTDFKEEQDNTIVENGTSSNVLNPVEIFLTANFKRLEMYKLKGMKILEYKKCIIKQMRYSLINTLLPKPFEIGEIQQKIYNQKWCTIIPIRSLVPGRITRVEVVVNNDEYSVCQFRTEKVQHLVVPLDITKSFHIPSTDLNLISDATFQGCSDGYIAIVVKIPDFVQQNFYVMNGLLRYSINNENGSRNLHDLMIGNSELTIDDIQNGTCDAVLSINSTVLDMVAVISCSTSATLCVNSLYPIDTQLCNTLSFQHTTLSNYLVRYSYTSAFGHIFISYKSHEDNTYCITIYARNEDELVIFIRSLANAFPSRPRLSKMYEKITDAVAYDMFSHDLQTLSSFFTNLLPPVVKPLAREIYFQIPADDWLKMIKTLKYFNTALVGEIEKKIVSIQNGNN